MLRRDATVRVSLIIEYDERVLNAVCVAKSVPTIGTLG